jgi:hypothetical protein
MKRLRIKCTDTQLGNVAWLYRTDDGGWRCMLSNRCPAAFSYAGIDYEKEAECAFALEDAGDDTAALWDVCRKHSRGTLWNYEVVS